MTETTLIIGASGGIGAALVAEAASRGQTVTTLSRSADGLDITDPDSISAAVTRLTPPWSRILIATGALEINGAAPEKTIRQLTADAMLDQFRTNALGPALLLQALIAATPRDATARIGVLSARVGSITDNRLGGWTSYRTAKAALNQVLRTTAVELSRTHPNVTLAALHPGTVATPFTEKYLGRHPAVSPAEAAANLLNTLDSLTPEQSGSFHDATGKPVPW